MWQQPDSNDTVASNASAAAERLSRALAPALITKVSVVCRAYVDRSDLPQLISGFAISVGDHWMPERPLVDTAADSG